MSGYIFRLAWIGLDSVEPASELSESFVCSLKLFIVVLTFIGYEDASFSDKRQAPFGKGIEIGNGSGYADVERSAAFRLAVDLFCSCVNGLKIRDAQSLCEFIYDSESF